MAELSSRRLNFSSLRPDNSPVTDWTNCTHAKCSCFDNFYEHRGDIESRKKRAGAFVLYSLRISRKTEAARAKSVSCQRHIFVAPWWRQEELFNGTCRLVSRFTRPVQGQRLVEVLMGVAFVLSRDAGWRLSVAVSLRSLCSVCYTRKGIKGNGFFPVDGVKALTSLTSY